MYRHENSRKEAYPPLSVGDTEIVGAVSRILRALICQQESSPYIGRSLQHVAHMTQSVDQSIPPDGLHSPAHSTKTTMYD